MTKPATATTIDVYKRQGVCHGAKVIEVFLSGVSGHLDAAWLHVAFFLSLGRAPPFLRAEKRLFVNIYQAYAENAASLAHAQRLARLGQGVDGGGHVHFLRSAVLQKHGEKVIRLAVLAVIFIEGDPLLHHLRLVMARGAGAGQVQRIAQRPAQQQHTAHKLSLIHILCKEEYAKAIGADFYSPDAMGSVKYAEAVFSNQ